jgi:hypothetical protein
VEAGKEEEEEDKIFIAQKYIHGGGRGGGKRQRENESRWQRRQFHQKRIRVGRWIKQRDEAEEQQESAGFDATQTH